jgi:hypothetical protein
VGRGWKAIVRMTAILPSKTVKWVHTALEDGLNWMEPLRLLQSPSIATVYYCTAEMCEYTQAK